MGLTYVYLLLSAIKAATAAITITMTTIPTTSAVDITGFVTVAVDVTVEAAIVVVVVTSTVVVVIVTVSTLLPTVVVVVVVTVLVILMGIVTVVLLIIVSVLWCGWAPGSGNGSTCPM